MGNPPDNEIPVLTNADIDAIVDTPAPFTNDDLSPITDEPVVEAPIPDISDTFEDLEGDEESEADEIAYAQFKAEVESDEAITEPKLVEMNAAARRVHR